MKTLLSILIVMISACAAPALAAGQRSVTASGGGEVYALPDRASVHLGVETQGQKLGAARAHVKKVVRAVLRLTDSMGIPRKRVNTTRTEVYPEYSTNPKTHSRELTGYRVSRDIVVRLHTVSKLGDLIERAGRVGVNRISPPRLTSSHVHQLQRQALQKATRDARANARAMAAALGDSLGVVRNITASGASAPRTPYVMAKRANGTRSGDSYEVGRIHVRASVTATFALRGRH